MSVRCTRILTLTAALALAALLPAAAFAALPVGLKLRLQAADASTSAPARIAVSGVAAAGCVPSIGSVAVDGQDISIDLATPTRGCDAHRRMPFRLLADPAASAGLPALAPQVYRVRVYADAGAGLGLVAFSLIDASAAATAPVPESGFWWTEAPADGSAVPNSGSGMGVEVQDGRAAIGLLGFSDAGSANWLFGSTALDGRVARVTLVQLANGDGWFAPIGLKPEAEAGPRLEIEFLSPTRARAWLVRTAADGTDREVRSLVFARSLFSAAGSGSAWSGRWVLVPDDGGAPRLFDFSTPGRRDGENFRLGDPGQDASLDCRLGSDGAHPDACTLSASSAAIADFDEVGLDRLTGHDANGVPIQMLRVPR